MVKKTDSTHEIGHSRIFDTIRRPTAIALGVVTSAAILMPQSLNDPDPSLARFRIQVGCTVPDAHPTVSQKGTTFNFECERPDGSIVYASSIANVDPARPDDSKNAITIFAHGNAVRIGAMGKVVTATIYTCPDAPAGKQNPSGPMASVLGTRNTLW